MVEPEKPFACVMPNCGMTFTNEDHLNVHTKKHDMVLQLGTQPAFVADQTPTPTRFIRNCDEIGLFQDLQNVNPFDEGFKRAMETKAVGLSLEPGPEDVDTLHTPQMFPLVDGEALFTNNQRNITISRSSSDESGAVKEYETTTISKLTNEVTTISRIVGQVVGKQDVLDKGSTEDVSIVRHEDVNKEINETVSYTNNVIKIHSNVEICRKEGINIETSKIPRIIYTDSVVKDATTKDVLLTDNKEKAPPIMSQKSLDFVVDSLEDHSETNKEKDTQLIKMLKRNYHKALSKNEAKSVDLDDFEIIIKKPDGRQVRMKPVDDDRTKIQDETKEKLKRVLSDKAEKKSSETNNKMDTQIMQNILPISTLPSGTLVPVTIVNPSTILITNSLQKIPIVPFNVNKVRGNFKKTVKRRNSKEKEEDHVTVEGDKEAEKKKMLEPRTAASRRYRQKQKVLMSWQAEENRLLKETNHKLVAENAVLKQLITEHLKTCPSPEDLRLPQAEAHITR